jgi:hypothetical protein
VAVGKSTLVDTFLRPYRMKEMDRIGEKTWKVKEKEEELLVCENKVTEAKKELERLREKKEYSQCETKSEDIKGLEKSMTALQEDISRLKLIDGENRAKLEALRKNIAKLTRDEDEMSRNRNFTEAQKIKEQLEEKVPCNHHYPAAALPSCCTAPPLAPCARRKRRSGSSPSSCRRRSKGRIHPMRLQMLCRFSGARQCRLRRRRSSPSTTKWATNRQSSSR